MTGRSQILKLYFIIILTSVSTMALRADTSALQIIKQYLEALPTTIRPIDAMKRWREMSGTACVEKRESKMYTSATCQTQSIASRELSGIKLKIDESGRYIETISFETKKGEKNSLSADALINILPKPVGKPTIEKGKDGTKSYSMRTTFGVYLFDIDKNNSLLGLTRISGSNEAIDEPQLNFKCMKKKNSDILVRGSTNLTKNVTAIWTCDGYHQILKFAYPNSAPPTTVNAWYKVLDESLNEYSAKSKSHPAWTEISSIIKEELAQNSPDLPTWDLTQNTSHMSSFRYGEFGIVPEVTTSANKGYEIEVTWTKPEALNSD